MSENKFEGSIINNSQILKVHDKTNQGENFQPLLNEDPTIQRGYQGDPSKNCLCPALHSAWHGYPSLMD